MILVLLSVIFSKFGADKIVLCDELVIEVVECRQVDLVQLSCQLNPLRMLNQVEEMGFFLIED